MTAPTPTWVFDESAIPDPLGHGERAVRFLRALKHPKSRRPGAAFELPRWQERIVRRIYGPCDPDGQRTVRTVVALLPRGNRKTSLGAALALLHTIGPERSAGGQTVCAAADQKQARLAFDEAAGIARKHSRIAKAVRFLDYKNRIEHPGSGSVLEAISSDAGTQHGRTPTFVLADELHAWKKRELWDVLRTGLVKVPGSLLCVITTAGRGQENVAHDIVDYARRVARGEVDDPATLPILFETGREADWRDERVWRAVNPGLADGFPDIKGLRQLAREAENRPADREAFRQLHLNVWLETYTDPFVELAVYDQGAEPVDADALAGQSCWIGVDMSTTTDLTAVVAAFRDGDEGFIVLPFLFCPADNLRARGERDGAPYLRWAEDGHLIATQGNVVDYRAVEACIRDLCERFDVREIAFDRALAQPVMAPLVDDGFPVVTMPLDPKSQAAGVNVLERAIVGGKFRHGGHPVLRWNVANVAIYTGPSGLRTMHKGKSTARIDGAFAAWMAVARAAAGTGARSIYEDPDLTLEDLVW